MPIFNPTLSIKDDEKFIYYKGDPRLALPNLKACLVCESPIDLEKGWCIVWSRNWSLEEPDQPRRIVKELSNLPFHQNRSEDYYVSIDQETAVCNKCYVSHVLAAARVMLGESYASYMG